MSQAWREAGPEPALEELFADPIFALLLERDRLSLASVRAAVGDAKRRLAARRLATAPERKAA